MTIQKKFLAFAILLAFFLVVNGVDNSYAKKKGQPSVNDAPTVVVAGTVLEIVYSDPEFDYLRVQMGTSDQWVAAPKKGFKKGDVISCEEGFVLENYDIKGLNRNFGQIVLTECSK